MGFFKDLFESRAAKKEAEKEKYLSDPIFKPLERYFSLSESVSISGLSKKKIDPFLKRNTSYDSDYETLKELYDCGDTFYEYEVYISPDRISIKCFDEKYHVYFDGVDIGYISAKKSEIIKAIEEKYGFEKINVDISYGKFKKIERKYDDARDDEYDNYEAESDDLWVSSGFQDKPKGVLTISYRKPWN